MKCLTGVCISDWTYERYYNCSQCRSNRGKAHRVSPPPHLLGMTDLCGFVYAASIKEAQNNSFKKKYWFKNCDNYCTTINIEDLKENILLK